jgi:hypothetical protein
VLGSRQLALTALFTRLLYDDRRLPLDPLDVAAVETALVRRSYGGDVAAYEAALLEQQLDRDLAWAIIADQLRRQTFAARLEITDPARFPDRRLRGLQREARRSAICLKDELPVSRPFIWSEHVPALTVGAASISIRADRQVVRRGSRQTLSGTIRSERAYEQVVIYRKRAGASTFVPIGVARVAGGRWSLTLEPAASARYRALSKGAASDSIVVRVRRKR